MAPHSSTLAWAIPWTEEPGRLQSMGSQRVGHDWATSFSLFTCMHWRRKWQPTSLFLPGESQGREPGGLPSMGSHRVGHDWCDLAAAASIWEKAIAAHSSTLAWKSPSTEEPGGLQSMGSQRVGHDWATSLSLFTFMNWRRKWQPTPVSLPGESQGWGAWWAAIYGVTQSRTRLKWLSISSSSSSSSKHVVCLVESVIYSSAEGIPKADFSNVCHCTAFPRLPPVPPLTTSVPENFIGTLWLSFSNTSDKITLDFTFHF